MNIIIQPGLKWKVTISSNQLTLFTGNLSDVKLSMLYYDDVSNALVFSTSGYSVVRLPLSNTRSRKDG